MHATVESTPETYPAKCDREEQSDRIARLIYVGDKEIALGNDAEATCSYYSIFQLDLFDDAAIGLHRLAPIELYEEAAGKLAAVAGRYAAQLIERGCYLPGESASGIVGVPRGALNLYLISNQYDAFTELALEYAVAELPKRNISRFLVSSIRARLNHLEKVRPCETLLDEEQMAFTKLTDFKARLQAHLAPHHAKTGRHPYSRRRRSGERALLRYA